jgi:predicted amidohydrolase
MAKTPKILKVVSLQLSLHASYQKNLEIVLGYLKKYKDKDIIIAPEVCLTGFDYKNIQKASTFSINAIEILKKEISEQILIVTLIIKKEGEFFNQALVIHQHKIVHTQEKVKLFPLGKEHQCFVLVSNASDKDMASSSAILSPFGHIIREDNIEAIEASIDLSEIKKMRRYIQID